MSKNNTIQRVRQFTRFYTNFFGLYNNSYLDQKFSLTEARVIFEIGRDIKKTSKNLIEALNLDPGYLSRIIKKFEDVGYVSKKQCAVDGRRYFIVLTDKGKKIRQRLDEETSLQIANMLKELSKEEEELLCCKMKEIENILNYKYN